MPDPLEFDPELFKDEPPQLSEADWKKIRDANDEYDFDKDPNVVAERRGLVVVYPRYDQLQIDIDSEEQYTEFRRRLEHMEGYWSICDIREVPSASGLPKRHVYITFSTRTFDDIERVMLQAALNDDPIRVFLNMKRIQDGESNPSRMFEKPENLHLL